MTKRSQSPTSAAGLTRRSALAGGAATAGAMTLLPAGAPHSAPDSASSNAPRGLGAQMLAAVEAWLTELAPTERDTATYSFDDRTWRRWSYMYGSRVAPGLPLEHMTERQKDNALSVLSLGLSNYGMQTASNIMLQQDILRDEWGKGSADRNRNDFP